MPERIIATLHAALSDGREVAQGQKVDLTSQDEESLEAQNALVPEGFESFEAFSDFKLDAYRAGRGDVIAAGRLAEAAQGGIVDLSEPGGVSGASYRQQIEQGKLKVDETVALAEGDSSKAEEVLTAENEATGGSPRRGVVDQLTKIING